MKFVTVANKNDGYLNILKKQITKSGNNLTILGKGEKWGGFMWRYIKISKFLSDLPDNEIVVIMDGYDVIFINDIGLEDKFKSYNTNILFGIEKIKCKFNKFLYEKTFPSKCKHNGNKISLNAGIYIGYAKYLKLFISHICNEYDCNNSRLDDQRILSHICDNDFFTNNIKFDIDCKIILNLPPDNLFTNKTSFALTDNKVVVNNNNPNFVHGPGNTDLNFILESYGYGNEIIEIRQNYKINGIKTYIKYFIPDIIIILLVIGLIIICFNI
jgi:hypothetical protein